MTRGVKGYKIWKQRKDLTEEGKNGATGKAKFRKESRSYGMSKKVLMSNIFFYDLKKIFGTNIFV